ncbi:hypothetical protein WR25_23495 isoform A [Diploscapter pachys]|uniref:Aminoglycoside phosphotransferase domain-containing protein n=1 Tax=Diploscapter pachys TaxID=2018661 RepID=A0A2A2LH11_9BILA|nr:hypothetical protein WR25_23495 isoform A [Diploscapter pachys]
MPGEEDVLVKQSVGSQSREPVKDNYDIAFSENNPSITFKDRAPQSSSDLKEVFSKFEADGPVSKEILSRARFLCAKYLGGSWNKVQIDNFKIRPVTGGMSNLLFLVELPPDLHPTSSEPPNALLRIYLQSDLDQLLTESVVFTLLSERNLGPKLLGVFPGGRFEQFIASRPLQCFEISQPRFAKKIAPLLARTHTLDAPITKEPQLITYCRNWLQKFRATPAGKKPIEIKTTEAQVDPKYYPASLTVDDLEKELDFVEHFLQNSGSPIVFSHNDLHEGNILLFNGYELKDDGSVAAEEGYPPMDFPISMIDFEYCSYNYR